jgi:F-box-like
MNSIQTSFSTLPEEYKLSILSLATWPRGLDPLISPERNEKYFEELLSKDINDSLRGSFKQLSKIALVCKKWYELQQDKDLWEPVFNRCLVNLRYEIDFSSALTCIEKVKLFIASLEGYRCFFVECATKNGVSLYSHGHCKYEYNNSNEKEKLLDYIQRMNGLNSDCIQWVNGFPLIDPDRFRMDFLFEKMISNNDLENLAKLMLFKPELQNASLVAAKFLNSENVLLFQDTWFCLGLMIKLNYDLSFWFDAVVNS